MVFNALYINLSAISWRNFGFFFGGGEAGVLVDNPRPSIGKLAILVLLLVDNSLQKNKYQLAEIHT